MNICWWSVIETSKGLGQSFALNHKPTVTVSGDLPGVDAADHVLSQEIGGDVAGPRGFWQEQDDQSSHLKVVLAVVDKPSVRKHHT